MAKGVGSRVAGGGVASLSDTLTLFQHICYSQRNQYQPSKYDCENYVLKQKQMLIMNKCDQQEMCLSWTMKKKMIVQTACPRWH